MARSIWKKTLVASLAWASFGWAQQPATTSRPMPDAVSANVERVITVQETGMPSHKCKVMKTWQTPEGATAYEVRALDTGEMMTIVENGPITSVAGMHPGTRVHAVATRIFRWNNSGTAPADAPQSPADAVQRVSATTVEPAPVQTYAAPQETSNERPSLLSRWSAKNRSREGATSSYSCNECQACDSQPARVAASPSPYKECQACDSQPARVAASPSPYAPVTSCNSSCESGAKPVITQQKTLILPALRISREERVTECTPLVAPMDRSKDSQMAQAAATSEMPHADSTKPDPLQAPEGLISRFTGGRGLFKSRSAKTIESAPEPTEMNEVHNSAATLPPGSQSVVGAGAAMGGQVQFVPVPIITMPDMNHPPMPPQHAPQLVMQPNSGAGNYAAVNKAPGPNMTTSDEGMVNAFTSMPSREAVAMGSNAFTDGETAAAGQAMTPPGAQQMYPRSLYGAMAQGTPMRMQTLPAGQAIVPASYQASVPGSPIAAASAAEQQMLSALHDSLYPSQREWAAEGLATLDWRVHPEVVQALVTAACADPAATVRAACVHHLARLNVNTQPVVEAVQKCKTDADPRVRQEAEQAMTVLHPGQQESRSMVQPVGSWRGN